MKTLSILLLAMLLMMPLISAQETIPSTDFFGWLYNSITGLWEQWFGNVITQPQDNSIKIFKVANQSGIDYYYDVTFEQIDTENIKITYCINEDRLTEAKKQVEFKDYKVPTTIKTEESISNSIEKTIDEAPVTTSTTTGKSVSCIEIIKNPYLVDMIKFGDNSTYIISVTQSTSGITTEAPFKHLSINGSSGNSPYNVLYRYWNFDYNDSDTIYGYYGTGWDLTFYYVNFSAGHTGNGADFDGVNSYMQASSISSLTTNTKTISFWAKPAGEITTNQTIFSLAYANYHLGFTDNNAVYFAYENYSGSPYFLVSADDTVMPNAWNLYTFVHYVDGSDANSISDVTVYRGNTVILDYQDSMGSIDIYGPTNIIGSYDGSTNLYNGSLDDFVFFGTNLTNAQVGAVYTSVANYFVPRGYILYEPIAVDISTASVNVSTNIQNFSSSKINLSIYYHNATGWFSSATQTISNVNNHSFNVANATAIQLNYTLIAGGTSSNLYSPILIGNPVISGVEQTSNIYDCGYLFNANMIYTLQSDVSSTGTCFTILAENITIDGNGYNITYGTAGTASKYGIYVNKYDNITIKNANIIEGNTTGSSKYGVYLIGSNYSNIQNNNISTNGTSGYGIYLITSINSTIDSNTISTNGTGSTGIYLPSSFNNTVTSNTITANGTSASGIYINRNGNYISNNNIRVKSSTTAYGIWGDVNMNNTIIDSNTINSVRNGIEIQTGATNTNWTITNNNITTTASSAEGIQFIGLRNSTISNNNITTGTAFGISFLTNAASSINITSNYITSNDAGISIAIASSTNNISFNTISTNAAGSEGITLTSPSKFIIANNNITTRKTTSIGISLLTSPNNNTITSNTILTNSSSALSIIGSNNVISNNILNTTGTYVITITTASSTNNTFNNNSIIGRNSSVGDIWFKTTGINGTIFINQYLEGYNFTGGGGKINVINTLYGGINFTASINGTGTNFSDDIKIGDNYAYVNSSQIGLNKSANITLFNLPLFTLPIIYWNGNQICNSTTNPSCYNFTSLNNVNVSFNVSSWSNYSIREDISIPPNITFLSQVPINITSDNIYTLRFNVTYNITDIYGINPSSIYYYTKTNSSINEIWQYINGTETVQGYQPVYPLHRVGVNITNKSDVWNFVVSSNLIYPSVFNLDPEVTGLAIHSYSTLSSTNDVLKIRFYNLTINSYATFNFMANSSIGASDLYIYYCNNSYTSGQVATSPYCTILANYPQTQKFNYTVNPNAQYNFIPFSMNMTKGMVNGIRVTEPSYIALKPSSSAGNWNVYYVTNISRPDTIRSSGNGGTSWSNFAGTVDAFISQYTPNNFTNYYYICANDTLGNGVCSNVRSNPILETNQTPSIPNVYSPINIVYYYNDNIPINYTASESPYQISYYNISILNDIDTGPEDNETENLTLNKTIIANNSVNLSYLWKADIIGHFKISVRAYDIAGRSSIGYSDEFNISKAIPSLTLSSSNGWTIPASTYDTITGSNCPAQLTCNLYQAGTGVANPYTALFPAGSYLFEYNTTGNANYSIGSVSNILNSQINGTGINGTISVPISECLEDRFVYNNPKVPVINGGC